MWPSRLCSSSLQEEQSARSRKSDLIAGGVILGQLLLPWEVGSMSCPGPSTQ